MGDVLEYIEKTSFAHGHSTGNTCHVICSFGLIEISDSAYGTDNAGYVVISQADSTVPVCFPPYYVSTCCFDYYTGTTAPAAFASKIGAITGGTSLGTGTGVYTSQLANKLQFKSLKVSGSLLHISSDSTSITISGSSPGGGTWGSITGILSAQLDLWNALTGKTSLDIYQTYTGTTAPATYLGINALNDYWNSGQTVFYINGRNFLTGVTWNQVTSKPNWVGSGATTVELINGNYRIYSPTVASADWLTLVNRPAWLTGTTLGAFETGHTHSQYALQTNINTYTGTTAPTTYETKVNFNSYTGTTVPTTYETKVNFNSYTGNTAPILSSAITGGTNGLTKSGRNLCVSSSIAGSGLTYNTGILRVNAASGGVASAVPIKLNTNCCLVVNCADISGVTVNNSLCLGGNLANTYAPLASPAFTTCITTPIACVNSCIRSPLISGGTICGLIAICSDIVCGTSCVRSPLVSGTTLCGNNTTNILANVSDTYLLARNSTAITGVSQSTFAPIVSPAFITCITTPIACISSCLRSPLISGGTVCGSTAVCGVIVCGTTCTSSPIVCASSCVRSILVSGTTICGLTAICGGIVCATSCVRSLLISGTTLCANNTSDIFTNVTDSYLLARNGAVITGVSQSTFASITSPAFTTCITVPIACISSCLRSPIISGNTCITGTLICGACGMFTTCVCSPIICGSTCACSAAVYGTKLYEGGICLANTYLPINSAISVTTGTTYTVQASDCGKILEFTNTGTTNITLPTGLTVGFQSAITNIGGGNKCFVAGTGANLHSLCSHVILAGAYNMATIYYRCINNWVIAGSLC